MIIGNTVRLEHTYMSWAGTPVDVTSPTIKVYNGDARGTPIETIELTDTEKIETGKYRYDYTVPDGIYDLVFEFSGVAENTPEVTRVSVPRTYT
jgi:hypothetical protein